MRQQVFPRMTFAIQQKLRQTITIFFLAALSIAAASPAFAIENLAYPATLVIDAKTGAVLHSNKAENRRYPASITKVMTLYVLFQELTAERVSLSTTITASQHAASARPTKLGLQRGSTLTVEEAILSMIIASANDSSRAVAELIAGSESRFAERMTATARALGMRNTNYANASGWPDPNNYTTAHDQAILGMAIYQHFPQFYHYFQRTSMTWGGRTYTGHNNVLGYRNVVDGLKTGWTTSSGSTILTSARDGSRHIIVVALGYPGSRARDTEVRTLVATYFNQAHAGDYWREVMIARAPIPASGQTIASLGATPLSGLPPIRPSEAISGTAPSISVNAGLAADQIPVRPTGTALEQVTQVAYASQGGMPADDPIGAWIMQLTATDAGRSAMQPAIEQTAQSTAGSASGNAGTGWIIQIGALDTPESAWTLLEQAARVETSLASIQSYVEPIERNGQTLYRARFSGFPNRAQASTACAALAEASLACLAISG